MWEKICSDKFDSLLLGDGIFHKYLMFVCGLCMMGVITETLVVSYIVTSAECDLSLTMTDKGLLTGAAFFGTSHLYNRCLSHVISR